MRRLGAMLLGVVGCAPKPADVPDSGPVTTAAAVATARALPAECTRPRGAPDTGWCRVAEVSRMRGEPAGTDGGGWPASARLAMTAYEIPPDQVGLVIVDSLVGPGGVALDVVSIEFDDPSKARFGIVRDGRFEPTTTDLALGVRQSPPQGPSAAVRAALGTDRDGPEVRCAPSARWYGDGPAGLALLPPSDRCRVRTRVQELWPERSAGVDYELVASADGAIALASRTEWVSGLDTRQLRSSDEAVPGYVFAADAFTAPPHACTVPMPAGNAKSQWLAAMGRHVREACGLAPDEADHVAVAWDVLPDGTNARAWVLSGPHAGTAYASCVEAAIASGPSAFAAGPGDCPAYPVLASPLAVMTNDERSTYDRARRGLGP
jgi:hypothetical protein